VAQRFDRVVVIIGRSPEIDAVDVGTTALAQAAGRVALMPVGCGPNVEQMDVIGAFVSLSSRWLESLFVYEIPPSDIRDDDLVVIAARGEEYRLLARMLGRASAPGSGSTQVVGAVPQGARHP